MTSKDFVVWMKGFAVAANDFTLTPKQWDDLKEQLGKVEDYGESQQELEDDFFGAWKEDPGTFQVHPEPPYPGVPLDRVGTQPGTGPDRYPWGGEVVWGGTSIPIPSDPNITGSVSITSVWTTNPNPMTYTVTSGSAWFGSTTYTYPNGTTVSYTAGGDKRWNIKHKDLLHD